MEPMIIQNAHHLNIYDDEMLNFKVPPPSPQDASMLETVFSKHLSAKMHTAVHHHHSNELHARKLNGLLLAHKKRPSRIPILSSRIISKKKQTHSLKGLEKRISNKEDTNKSSSGLVTMIMNMNKKDKMDYIVQELKEMGL